MKTTPASTVAVPFRDKLSCHDILLQDPATIEKYVATHAGLDSLVDTICQKVREEFGPASELMLQIYEDAELDDQYPTLYVRQEPYDSNIIERIEAVCANFQNTLESTDGYFLVTTDFRRPGTIHAV